MWVFRFTFKSLLIILAFWVEGIVLVSSASNATHEQSHLLK